MDPKAHLLAALHVLAHSPDLPRDGLFRLRYACEEFVEYIDDPEIAAACRALGYGLVCDRAGGH